MQDGRVCRGHLHLEWGPGRERAREAEEQKLLVQQEACFFSAVSHRTHPKMSRAHHSPRACASSSSPQSPSPVDHYLQIWWGYTLSWSLNLAERP